MIRSPAAAIAIAIMLASPAMGQGPMLGEVDIPAQRQWCLMRSMAAGDLNDPLKQEENLTLAMRVIAIEAANTSIATIGMPSVTAVVPGKTDSDPIAVTFCSNVGSPDAPAGGSGLQVVDRGAIRAVAASCGATDFDQCDRKLTAALMAEPWNFTEDEIAALAAVTGETKLTGDLSDEAVAAINAADVLLYDKASDTVITLPVFGNRITVIAYRLP